MPAVETLRDLKLSIPLRIYSTDDKLIGEFGAKRNPVSIKDVPPLLIKALLAIEDDTFYSHNGVEISAFLRAASQYLLRSDRQTGASTLTMQVAKKAFLENDGTLIYKANQILLALQIEKELTKDEILELYLNINFLGENSNGVGAAAQTYYGKDVSELSLAQMAALVATFNLPSTVNPIVNPTRTTRRRNLVLSQMLELGFIDRQQYETAVAEPLGAVRHNRAIDLNAPYVAEMARQEVCDQFEDCIQGGYIVRVTVDSKLQAAAQKALVNGLLEYDLRHGYRGPEEFVYEPEYIDLEDDQRTDETDSQKQAEGIVELPEDLTQNSLDDDNEAQARPPRIYKLAQHSNVEQTRGSDGQEKSDSSDKFLNLEPWIQELALLTDTYAGIQPAAVLEAYGDKLIVLLEDGRDISIPWENGPSSYLNSRSQPEPANEEHLILGNVVRVRQTDNGQWHLVQIPEVQGAFVALDPNNGAIRALVGGLDYFHSRWNRAIQGKRPPGSNFKPLLYTAALENGFSAGTILNDMHYSVPDPSREDLWTPQNHDGKFDGPMRLREALYRSRNVVSVRLLSQLGLRTAFKDIGRFGIDYNDLPKNDMSLALGTYELTPLQVANAYARFANGGYQVEPYFIESIETVDGDVLTQASPLTVCEECERQQEQQQATDAALSKAPKALEESNSQLDSIMQDEAMLKAGLTLANPVDELEAQLLAELEQLNDTKPATTHPAPKLRIAPRVIDERTAYIINDILKDVIRNPRGTANKARRPLGRSDIAGKTGTTNESHDLWFSGFNPTLVATSWVGYDLYQPLGDNEFGGTAALPPWIEFMQTALAGTPEIERPMPAGLVKVRINSKTGKPTTADDPSAVWEIFKVENSPLPADTESTNLIFQKEEVNPDDLF